MKIVEAELTLRKLEINADFKQKFPFRVFILNSPEAYKFPAQDVPTPLPISIQKG